MRSDAAWAILSLATGLLSLVVTAHLYHWYAQSHKEVAILLTGFMAGIGLFHFAMYGLWMSRCEP